MKITLGIIVLFLLVLPVHAQNDEDELITLVTTAYETLWEQDSFQFESEIKMQQNAPNTPPLTLQTVTAQVQANDPIPDYAVVSIQENEETTITLEILLVESKSYIRVEGVPQFSEEWSSSSEVVGFNSITPEFFAEFINYNYMALYPLDEVTISEVRELPSEEIDGQTMRVIHVTRGDAFLVEFIGVLLGGFMPQGEFDESVLEGFSDTTFTQQVWIGGDDGLPHRLEYVFETGLAGTAVTIKVTGLNTFFDFNEPVTVEAPVIE